MSDIGENISKKMKELGLSQNRLAKLSGISQPGISGILNNTKSPSVDTVQLIASTLNCTVSELMGESGSDGLSGPEAALLRDYRALSSQGQEYIRQQMAMALKVYPGESVLAADVAE